jgi:hypothetical protein
MSGVLQGSVLGPLLFLAYVNVIWKNIESTIRLFADDCIIYRKNLSNDVESLQIDLNRLGEWAFENEIIKPAKSNAVCFMKSQVMESLNYSLGDILLSVYVPPSMPKNHGKNNSSVYSIFYIYRQQMIKHKVLY